MPTDALRVSPPIRHFCWRIEHQVGEGGFALVNGDPGTGKSAALRLLGERLARVCDLTVGVLTRPQASLADFYRELGRLWVLKSPQRLMLLIRNVAEPMSGAMAWVLLVIIRWRFECPGEAAALRLGNLALRQQLGVLSRATRRPRIRGRDRHFWIALKATWAGWRQALVIVRPARSRLDRSSSFPPRPLSSKPQLPMSEPHFVPVADVQSLPPGQGRTVEWRGRRFALWNIDGAFYAIDDDCPHRGGPLGAGVLDRGYVHCPLHGWAFDPRTGACESNPSRPVACHATKVENGQVWIAVPNSP